MTARICLIPGAARGHRVPTVPEAAQHDLSRALPKLNAFGIVFRNNGYKIQLNEASLIKTPDVLQSVETTRNAWLGMARQTIRHRRHHSDNFGLPERRQHRTWKID
jgi:hypothetical protein